MTDITHTPHGAFVIDDIVLTRFASYVTAIASDQDALHDWDTQFKNDNDREAYAAYVLAVPGTNTFRDPIQEFGSDHVGSWDSWDQVADALSLVAIANMPINGDDLTVAADGVTLDLPDWAERTVRRYVDQECHTVCATSGRVHLFRRRP